MTSSPLLTHQTKYTGAELIVHLLEQQGVQLVVGIPGGAILPLYDALSQSHTIQHILARHEQAAGFIAQGMARVTGKAAVCIASSGPGATNLVTAIADAKLDSIPLVCITGQVPLNMIGTDAFQEVDTYGIAIPITKHNYLVRDIHDLPNIINDAFRLAESGRPGPVWIDIPKDIQTATLTIDKLPTPAQLNPPPHLTSHQLQDVANLINQAKQPVLYLGGGIIHSASDQAVLELVEKSNLPTTTTLMALGCIPNKHPLFLGMLGMHGTRCANMLLAEADVLIVLGARFDDRAIGYAEQFCPNAKIIHIDIDPSELGKIKQPIIGIHGDIKQILPQLIPLIEENPREAWLKTLHHFKQQYPNNLPNISDPLSHYGLILAVANCVDDNVIITNDVGQHQMWAAQAYPLCRARQWLTSGGLGTMGFGLPAAIGAALSKPNSTIICFSGDGSIMMNIQEMATAAELQLNIKIILMNNQALGMVHQQQSLFYDQNIFAATYPYFTDFIKIAAGFGLTTYDLNQSIDPRQTLQEAMHCAGPCLIHALIDTHQKVFPMVPPGAANTQMIEE